MTRAEDEAISPPDQPAEATAMQPTPSLNNREKWDITFLVMAFSCVFATLTLVVGTGPVVILSAGGDASMAPFALAVVFMGMSFISLTVTHWIFAKWGRKVGFWVGNALGLAGVLVGCWGLLTSSPGIVLVAQSLMGSGLGIGMYLRFSAVEVVPPDYSSRAVAWVLCGGCLAAFVGPETSQATKGVFGDENFTYIGTFVVAGCFFILQAIFVGLVGFPTPNKKAEAAEGKDTKVDAECPPASTSSSDPGVWSIVQQFNFMLPLGVATLCWAIMAMPMGIFRLTMGELGFTERQSLTVIEFHFLAMYAPGPWSGTFIKKYGFVRACEVALVCFTLGLAIDLSIQDNNNSTAAWFLGLILLGIGWNFGFSSATVWSTQSYQHAMHLRPKIQAANECGMFLVSGGAIFSSGYIYNDAGGGGIKGWRLLNGVLFSLVALFAILIDVASRTQPPSKDGMEECDKKDGAGVLLADVDRSGDEVA